MNLSAVLWLLVSRNFSRLRNAFRLAHLPLRGATGRVQHGYSMFVSALGALLCPQLTLTFSAMTVLHIKEEK